MVCKTGDLKATAEGFPLLAAKKLKSQGKIKLLESNPSSVLGHNRQMRKSTWRAPSKVDFRSFCRSAGLSKLRMAPRRNHPSSGFKSSSYLRGQHFPCLVAFGRDALPCGFATMNNPLGIHL